MAHWASEALRNGSLHLPQWIAGPDADTAAGAGPADAATVMALVTMTAAAAKATLVLNLFMQGPRGVDRTRDGQLGPYCAGQRERLSPASGTELRYVGS